MLTIAMKVLDLALALVTELRLWPLLKYQILPIRLVGLTEQESLVPGSQSGILPRTPSPHGSHSAVAYH